MAVNSHVAAADVENGSDERSAVKVLAPVLVQDIGGLVREHPQAFPHGHAFLEVLLFYLLDLDRLDRTLDQLVALFHGLFIATLLAGDFSGNGELDLFGGIKRILQ